MLLHARRVPIDASVRCVEVVGQSVWIAQQDGDIAVYDVLSGRLIGLVRPTYRDRGASATAMHYDKQNGRVWVGGSDGTIIAYDSAKATVLHATSSYVGLASRTERRFCTNVLMICASSDFLWSAGSRDGTLLQRKLDSISLEPTEYSPTAAKQRLKVHRQLTGHSRPPKALITTSRGELWSAWNDGIRVFIPKSTGSAVERKQPGNNGVAIKEKSLKMEHDSVKKRTKSSKPNTSLTSHAVEPSANIKTNPKTRRKSRRRAEKKSGPRRRASSKRCNGKAPDIAFAELPTPVGSLVEATDGCVWSGGSDGVIRVWSLHRSGDSRPIVAQKAVPFTAHKGTDGGREAHIVSLVRAERWICSATFHNLVKVWDARTRALVRVVELPQSLGSPLHIGYCLAKPDPELGFSADASVVPSLVIAARHVNRGYSLLFADVDPQTSRQCKHSDRGSVGEKCAVGLHSPGQLDSQGRPVVPKVSDQDGVPKPSDKTLSKSTSQKSPKQRHEIKGLGSRRTKKVFRHATASMSPSRIPSRRRKQKALPRSASPPGQRLRRVVAPIKRSQTPAPQPVTSRTKRSEVRHRESKRHKDGGNKPTETAPKTTGYVPYLPTSIMGDVNRDNFTLIAPLKFTSAWHSMLTKLSKIARFLRKVPVEKRLSLHQMQECVFAGRALQVKERELEKLLPKVRLVDDYDEALRVAAECKRQLEAYKRLVRSTSEGTSDDHAVKLTQRVLELENQISTAKDELVEAQTAAADEAKRRSEAIKAAEAKLRTGLFAEFEACKAETQRTHEAELAKRLVQYQSDLKSCREKHEAESKRISDGLDRLVQQFGVKESELKAKVSERDELIETLRERLRESEAQCEEKHDKKMRDQTVSSVPCTKAKEALPQSINAFTQTDEAKKCNTVTVTTQTMTHTDPELAAICPPLSVNTSPESPPNLPPRNMSTARTITETDSGSLEAYLDSVRSQDAQLVHEDKSHASEGKIRDHGRVNLSHTRADPPTPHSPEDSKTVAESRAFCRQYDSNLAQGYTESEHQTAMARLELRLRAEFDQSREMLEASHREQTEECSAAHAAEIKSLRSAMSDLQAYVADAKAHQDEVDAVQLALSPNSRDRLGREAVLRAEAECADIVRNLTVSYENKISRLCARLREVDPEFSATPQGVPPWTDYLESPCDRYRGMGRSKSESVLDDGKMQTSDTSIDHKRPHSNPTVAKRPSGVNVVNRAVQTMCACTVLCSHGPPGVDGAAFSALPRATPTQGNASRSKVPLPDTAPVALQAQIEKQENVIEQLMEQVSKLVAYIEEKNGTETLVETCKTSKHSISSHAPSAQLSDDDTKSLENALKYQGAIHLLRNSGREFPHGHEGSNQEAMRAQLGYIESQFAGLLEALVPDGAASPDVRRGKGVVSLETPESAKALTDNVSSTPVFTASPLTVGRPHSPPPDAPSSSPHGSLERMDVDSVHSDKDIRRVPCSNGSGIGMAPASPSKIRREPPTWSVKPSHSPSEKMADKGSGQQQSCVHFGAELGGATQDGEFKALQHDGRGSVDQLVHVKTPEATLSFFRLSPRWDAAHRPPVATPQPPDEKHESKVNESSHDDAATSDDTDDQNMPEQPHLLFPHSRRANACGALGKQLVVAGVATAVACLATSCSCQALGNSSGP